MRGYRLQQANKIAKKVFRVYNSWQSIHNWRPEPRVIYIWDGSLWQRYRKTKIFCSKFCCGNQRKYEGPTIQELRQYDKEDIW